MSEKKKSTMQSTCSLIHQSRERDPGAGAGCRSLQPQHTHLRAPAGAVSAALVALLDP